MGREHTRLAFQRLNQLSFRDIVLKFEWYHACIKRAERFTYVLWLKPHASNLACDLGSCMITSNCKRYFGGLWSGTMCLNEAICVHPSYMVRLWIWHPCVDMSLWVFGLSRTIDPISFLLHRSAIIEVTRPPYIRLVLPGWAFVL